MNLLAILITLGTESMWKSVRAVRPHQWLIDYVAWLWLRVGKERWFGGTYGVLLALAPGIVGVALVQITLANAGGFIAWVVRFAFDIAVLILSIGVRGMDYELDEYRRALERNDHESAYMHVREMLRNVPPVNADDMNRRLIEVMLVRNNERLLAILFWFALLGPVGAVAYRSVCQLKGIRQSGGVVSEGFLAGVLQLHAIIDWIPARITAVCYAAIGSFVESVQQWRAGMREWGGDPSLGNRLVLVNSGLGALRLHDLDAGRDNDSLREDIIDAEALVNRTVIVWLTAYGLLTIAAWLH